MGGFEFLNGMMRNPEQSKVDSSLSDRSKPRKSTRVAVAGLVVVIIFYVLTTWGAVWLLDALGMLPR